LDQNLIGKINLIAILITDVDVIAKAIATGCSVVLFFIEGKIFTVQQND